MGQLHLIKTENGFNKAQNFVSKGDELLLIEESVYLGIEKPSSIQKENIFLLLEDLDLRGLLDLIEKYNFNIVSYQDMVKIVAEAQKTITWF
ncbi:MAG: sulfur relay protein TusB/DsrH [Francisellaceae bacterium]|jgi:sulfur relay protein TusB/DsrH